MKNKFLILLKTTISNSFKLKTTSTKKKIFIGIFAIYLLGCLMFTFKTNLDSGTFETPSRILTKVV